MKENTSKLPVATADAAAESVLGSGGAGSALFVINLCTSMAPIPTAGKALPGLEDYRLYQVMRVEDGRTRYRLRLGFFTAKADADNALKSVRERYPTAFATCLSAEDQKFARSYAGRAKPAAAPPAPRGAAKTSSRTEESAIVEIAWEPPPNKSAGTQPAVKAAGAAQPGADKPVAKKAPAPPGQAKPGSPTAPAATPGESPVIELTLEPERTATAKPAGKQGAPTEPFHVGRGADTGAFNSTGITLQTDSSATPAAAPVPSSSPKESQRRPAASRGAPTTAHASARTPASAPTLGKSNPVPSKPVASNPVKSNPVTSNPATSKPLPKPGQMGAPAAGTGRTATPPPATGAAGRPAPLPDLDSTQTIRALTTAELEDDSQEKWFAIQLAISEQPVNLDAMPRLDIFEAYRLYSVANAASGKILHSLRLGFFREQVSAEAVAGYLHTFFPDPTAIRISAAEQARFKDSPAHPRPAAPKPEAKVIELSQARERSGPVVPTVTLEVSPGTGARHGFDPGATGTFKPNATGSFKLSQNGLTQSGAQKVLTPTLKPAARSGPLPAKKRSAGLQKDSATGKYRALPRKSLTEALLEEAREVELSESGIHKLPKNDSLLSRLVGKLTK